MKKALTIAKEISRDYAQCINNKKYKPISCHSIGHLPQEQFSAKSVSGKVSVEASNTQAAAYAISQLRVGALSGHLSEYLQEQRPLYPLRPLWLRCDKHVAISEKLGVWLPGFVLEKNKKMFELFCRRLLELGFNALVLGSHHFGFCEKSTVTFKELPLLREMLADYGIRLIVKPVIYFRNDEEDLIFLPNHPRFRDVVAEALSEMSSSFPELDYLLWESVYLHTDFQRHPMGRDLTKLEKVVAEEHLVESCLRNTTQLIYYLPCSDISCAGVQAEWIPDLLNEMGDKAIFAFSAVSGDPREDHALPHPFWDKLRKVSEISSVPLMPLLNSGGVNQGEGLWPGLTVGLIEEYHSRCVRGNISGVINLGGHMPREGSLADCNLWVAGQRMWRSLSSSLLAHSWFEAKRGDIDYLKHQDCFHQMRQMIKALSFLRSLKEEKNRDKFSSEECRLYAENLFAQLKYLEYYGARIEGCGTAGKTSLKVYIQYFVNDARRIIHHSLQSYNISINMPGEEEGSRDGVWTEIRGGEGGRSVSQFVFLNEARQGEVGSSLHRLIWESRIDID